jgi:hypothetical protein
MTRFEAMVQAEEDAGQYNKEKLLQNIAQLPDEQINKLCLDNVARTSDLQLR